MQWASTFILNFKPMLCLEIHCSSREEGHPLLGSGVSRLDKAIGLTIINDENLV
jgi:hypothetical protein